MRLAVAAASEFVGPSRCRLLDRLYKVLPLNIMADVIFCFYYLFLLRCSYLHFCLLLKTAKWQTTMNDSLIEKIDKLTINMSLSDSK